MRPIDAEQVVTMELFDDEHEEYYKKKISIEDMIATYTTEMELPTIDAIPVEWIKEWVNEIGKHVPSYKEEEKKIIIGDYEEMFEVWEKLKKE